MIRASRTHNDTPCTANRRFFRIVEERAEDQTIWNWYVEQKPVNEQIPVQMPGQQSAARNEAAHNEAVPQNAAEELRPNIRQYGLLLNRMTEYLNATKSFFSRDSQEFTALLGYMNAIGDFAALDQRQMKEALNAIGVAEDFRSMGAKKYVDNIIARNDCYAALNKEMQKGAGADEKNIANAYAKLMVMNVLDASSHSKRRAAEYDGKAVRSWTTKILRTDAFKAMLRDTKGIKAMVDDYKMNPGMLHTDSEAKLSESLLKEMAKEKNITGKLNNKGKAKEGEPVHKIPELKI